ncbi:MAG: DUF4197 domain-containing protein [Bacteroidetes bacterium HGW-Bacteroidetes-22]|nr:MAG: DUF4197 domain-containing protein [Bacteroidetes bacterium HGW-Bacteroidetes-22]
MKHLFRPLVVAFLVIISLTRCDKVDDIISGLTEQDVVQGLKSALTVGADTAVVQLNKVNGYFGNQILKILLPEEASVIVENIALIPGGSDLIDELVLRMNRAAEDAAGGATPVFVNAITSMSFSDAFGILNGADSAATHYLREKTYGGLYGVFKPIIGESLSKPLIAGISANDAWENLTTPYNELANSLAGQILNLTPVTITLDDHVTRKGLNGLFIKIAEEEKAIRTDPLARVNEILKKVFG